MEQTAQDGGQMTFAQNLIRKVRYSLPTPPPPCIARTVRLDAKGLLPRDLPDLAYGSHGPPHGHKGASHYLNYAVLVERMTHSSAKTPSTFELLASVRSPPSIQPASSMPRRVKEPSSSPVELAKKNR